MSTSQMQPTLFKVIDTDKLTLDMFQAYYDARKNKRNTINALAFEKHLETNVFTLCEQVCNRQYEPKPSICFVVDKPIKREIFAANFSDRVIHHLIYNYISPVFEPTFINDSYSCRKGKGTHYGIKRLDHFIRSCSDNYTRDCYVLKLDIKGYFMAMNKVLLFDKIKMQLKSKVRYCDFEIPLVTYLIEKIVFNDPRHNCKIKGRKADWEGLPPSKSLFHAKPNCGLPIGNLTSQLFGNIYMNSFDHWVKRELGIKHYGRYVDDFVLVHPDKEYLKSCIPIIRNYLKEELQLELHPNKIHLQHYSKGVQYLGAVIKPHRIYVSRRITGNFYATIAKQNRLLAVADVGKEVKAAFISSMNSYLGIMKHYKSYKVRKSLIFNNLSPCCWKCVYLEGGVGKFVMKRNSF
jgi:RNA-directed DNA polymerase